MYKSNESEDIFEEKRNIMLWGWYGYENLGDDLLLDTMLKQLYGDITVPINKTYNLPGVKQISRNYKNLLMGAFHNDVLIIGPGGLFPFDNKIKVIIYYIITMFWKLLNRKVIFFGIGISERMSDFSVIMWRIMVKKADLFITRSKKILKRIDVDESQTVHSAADCVFASDINQISNNIKSNRVIISVANLQQDNNRVFEDVVKKWRDVIITLTEKEYEVDLIAFTKGRDDEMIAAITSSLNSTQMVNPIYYKDSFEAIHNWGQYKFAICMRFHSLVLSILNNVPAVPIAYGQKTFSLAEMCNLSKYALVWNTYQSEYYGKSIDVSVEQIMEKVNQLCGDIDNVKIEMQSYKDELINSASNAFLQLMTVLYH